MVYCKECSCKSFCSKVDKSQDIECSRFKKDLDFLIDSEEDFGIIFDSKKERLKEIWNE